MSIVAIQISIDFPLRVQWNLMKEISSGLLRRSSGSPIFTVLCVEFRNDTGSRCPTVIIWYVIALTADWPSWKETNISRGSYIDTKDVTSATPWDSTREYTVFFKLSKLADFCQAEMLMEVILATLVGYLSFPIYTTLSAEFWPLVKLTERFLW